MKKSELIFSAILVPLDWMMLIAAGLTAYGLRFHPTVVDIRPVIFELPFADYIKIVVLVATIWLVIFALSGLYRIESSRGIINEIIRVVLGCSTGFLAVVLYIFWQREFFSSRFIIIAAWFLTIVLVSFGRIIIRFIQRFLFARGVGLHNILIIGNDRTAERLSAEYHRKSSLGYHIISRIKEPDSQIVNEVKRLSKEQRIDDILFIDNQRLNPETVFHLVNWASLAHINFHYSSDYLNLPTAGVDIVSVAGIPIMEFKKTTLDGWGRILKRIFDIVVSFILITVLSPLLLIIALFIRLDSTGKIFFSELDDGSPLMRIGQYGKRFRYFKFRTMIPKSHRLRYTSELQARNIRKGSPMIKIKDDPRITRIGKFLRRYSLDELPELFLVLTSKMSLVGPRPHLPEEVARYQDQHKFVLTIKPGLTGLAQISGRSDLNFEDEVKLDAYYIKNWSPKLDLQILVKTIPAVLRKRGAE